MARHFEPHPTIIIPYGLKSWLECICRAVFIERPENLTEFISVYCEELHSFREQNILVDTKEVIHLYQELREAKFVREWIAQRVPPTVTMIMNDDGPMAPRPFVPETPMTEISIEGSQVAEMALLATQNIKDIGTSGETMDGLEEQFYPGTKTPDPNYQEIEHSRAHPSVEEESQPGSAVQSAAFSMNHLVNVGQSDVISKPSAPTDNVIAVHSENIPETTILSRDSPLSSALLPRTPSVGHVTGLCDPTVAMSNEEVSFKMPLPKNLLLTYSADSLGSLGLMDNQLSSRSSSEISWEDLTSLLATGQVVDTTCYQGDTEIIRPTTEHTTNAPSETVLDEECKEESREREGETLGRHSSPKESLTVVQGTSEMAHAIESPTGTGITPTSSLTRVASALSSEKEIVSTDVICEDPSEQLLQLPEAAKGDVLPALSPVSDTERAPCETAVKEQRLMSVRIFQTEESVGIPPERPEAGTPTRISPRQSQERTVYTRPSAEDLLITSSMIEELEELVLEMKSELKVSRTDITAKAPSATVTQAVNRGSALSMPCRESVWRPAETPEQETFTNVSLKVSPQTSLVSAGCSPKVSLSRLSSSLLKDPRESAVAAGDVSPPLSTRASLTDTTERVPSEPGPVALEASLFRSPIGEERVERPAVTPERHTSPGVSPRTSLESSCVSVSLVRALSNPTSHSRATGRESVQKSVETQTFSDSGLLDKTTQVTRPQSQSMHDTSEDRDQSLMTGFTGLDQVNRSEPPLQNFRTANSVWTLYHLTRDSSEGCLSTTVLSQPPFNGSAYIRNFGPGHVLLAEMPCQKQAETQNLPSQPELCQHHPPQLPQAQPGPSWLFFPRIPSSALPHPLSRPNQDINIPNHFLFLDGNQVSLGQSAPASTTVPTGYNQPSGVRTNQAAGSRKSSLHGFLSLFFPVQYLSGEQSSQNQFLQVISEEGQMVYSPTLIHVLVPQPNEEERPASRETSSQTD